MVSMMAQTDEKNHFSFYDNALWILFSFRRGHQAISSTYRYILRFTRATWVMDSE